MHELGRHSDQYQEWSIFDTSEQKNISIRSRLLLVLFALVSSLFVVIAKAEHSEDEQLIFRRVRYEDTIDCSKDAKINLRKIGITDNC